MEIKKFIDAKKLKQMINKNRLLAVVQDTTTNRVAKIRFYYVYNNHPWLVDSKTYKSGAIGMNRVFDCFCMLCNDFGIKLTEIEQNYIILGE